MTGATVLTGLDRNKVHIGFKHIFGISLHDYCFDRRMQRARQLLVESSMSIALIAGKAGFSEPTNFTAAFPKQFGLLPSDARRSPQKVF